MVVERERTVACGWYWLCGMLTLENGLTSWGHEVFCAVQLE